MPQIITDYELIADDDPRQFNRKVSEKLTQGWQPYGPPSMNLSATVRWCAQAMVKYQKPMDHVRAQGHRPGHPIPLNEG